MPLDATTVRLLPEHVDLSIVLTTAGLGAFGTTCIGAYGHGHLGVLGSYGALALATMISVVGLVRWDLRAHGRPPRRR